MEVVKQEIIKTKQNYLFNWLDQWLRSHYAFRGIKVQNLPPNIISITATLQNPAINGNSFIVRTNAVIEKIDYKPYAQFWGEVFVITVLQLSDDRAEVIAKCLTDVQELVDIFDAVWNEIILKFEIIEPSRNGVAQVSAAKPDRPKQKGRYRLTKDEIKRRKKIVKDAERAFKESNPKKTWKQIAYELGIPERTLRDWRHNPEY